MKALIIGAAGFVGKYLADHLMDAGWDVSATHLPSETVDLHIPMYELDILEPKSITSLLKALEPKYIFHLAALSSVALSWKQPAITVDINIKGAINLLEAVREMEKQPRVLLVGSGEEYGYVRAEELPIEEDTPLRPGNIYAASKIAQGMMGQIYARAYGLEVIIVRAFNHVGPGQTDTFVIPEFCKQIAMIEAGLCDPIMHVGNMESRRDFTDVRDIVRAYRFLAEKGESGIIYNVGSGKSVSIRYMLDILLSLSKKEILIIQDPARMRPSDTPVIEADISRIHLLADWTPEISITTTLEEMLDEWRKRIIVPDEMHTS